MVKVREAFGVDSDLEVPAFSEADERVPDLDPPTCSIRTRRWRFARVLLATAG
jgi:hypothetical protein